MKFEPDKTQLDTLAKWLDEHNKTCKFADDDKRLMPLSGAIGGIHTYIFTPTGLGVILKMKCACGGHVDLTNYDFW